MENDQLYEWDQQKATANLEKHGVSFEEAETVFDDDFSVSIVDERHSNDEARYIELGISKSGKLLVVAYTDRAGRIRIISAREASRNEQNFYEQNRLG